MRIYKNLLVLATEASDPKPAFEQALELARATQAQLTLLDIADPIPEETQALIEVGILDSLESASREQRTARLRALAEVADAAGIKARTKLATGSVFRIAIREALAEGHDLVLKTVDTRSERSLSPLGSADKHLLRKCPCPLWLAAPNEDGGRRDVLAAVDPNPLVPEEEVLSGDILEAAAAAARVRGDALHVLHAWKVFGEPLLRGQRTVASGPDVDQIVSRARERHAGFLEGLLKRVSLPVPAEPHLVHASPAEAIIEFVQSRRIRLLVMGTVGRTGIPGFLIGNTAERVLSEVTCSVLALKPRGFVSPVNLDS